MLVVVATFFGTLSSILRSRAALAVENLALRHQIGVLRELLKLGIDIAESSVAKYMARCRKPPSQTWRTFLENHISQLASIDFFTVPTIRFQVLYVFLVLAHDRRRVLRFNVTRHTTAAWTGQQLREAFPFDQHPGYLLRDRDAIFGNDFTEQILNMGIDEVLSTPHSPWQRAYVERVIGSIRRECLDHMIVFDENSPRRTLASYFDYYHRSRTHLSLRKDSPEPRPTQPPRIGPIVALPQVGGLHHRLRRPRRLIECLAPDLRNFGGCQRRKKNKQSFDDYPARRWSSAAGVRGMTL